MRPSHLTGWDRMLLAVASIVTIYSVGVGVAGLFLGDQFLDGLVIGPVRRRWAWSAR